VDALRPLSLDQFAAMTAEIEAGFPRDRVLADATVSAEQWELTQETWLLRMAKQGQQRKLALLDRYNELLAKHRKAAQRKMRAEKRKLKGPMPVAPEAHLSPLARVRADDGTGATFQQQGVATAPGTAWAVTASGPGAQGTPARPQPGLAEPPMVAPPMVAPPPVVSPVPAPQGVGAPPMVTASAMLADDGAAIDVTSGPAWLEASRPASEAPAGPAWLDAKRPPAHFASTVRSEDGPLPGAAVAGPAWLAAKPPARAEEQRAAPSPASPPVAAAGPAWLHSNPSFSAPLPQVAPPAGDGHAGPPPPAQSPSPPRRPGKGATLMDQKLSDLAPAAPAGPAWLAQGTPKAPADTRAAADGLPFQRAASPPQAQAAAAPPAGAQGAAAVAGGLPFQRAASPQASVAAQPAPAAQRPATQAGVAAQPAPAAQGARPATQGAHAAPPGPRLSIERFAWLQAQAETSAELGRAAREQLGLSEAEYAGERAFWQARFQQDRATVERYSQLFYHYKRAR
jgi:hypothetical protein